MDSRADGRLALVLGDVSGKSIPASLLMVAAKEIVHGHAMADPDPAVVFKASNRRLYEIKRRMFVSLSYFLLDPEGPRDDVRVRGPADAAPRAAGLGRGGRDRVPRPHGCRSAPSATRVYDAASLYLSRGDLLLFYTDGLNEAMSAEMTPYGDERLKASLVRARPEAARGPGRRAPRGRPAVHSRGRAVRRHHVRPHARRPENPHPAGAYHEKGPPGGPGGSLARRRVRALPLVLALAGLAAARARRRPS